MPDHGDLREIGAGEQRIFALNELRNLKRG